MLQSSSKALNLSKYILRTEVDPQSWKFYKKQEAQDWSAEEFSFVTDRDDYQRASPRIRHLLKSIFGFFLIGDGIISEDLIPMITTAVSEGNWPKVFYLCMQLKVENTHAETYSKAALTIIPEEEHQEMFEMCEKLECVTKKSQWIANVNSYGSKGLENVACALGEGVGFVSLFAVIFYLRKLNMFNDFIESNEQISKDESVHRDEKAAEAKRSLLPEEHERAITMIKEFVIIEKMHADYLLNEPVISYQIDQDAGLTKANLHIYIEMLADQVAVLCGLDVSLSSQTLTVPIPSVTLGSVAGTSVSASSAKGITDSLPLVKLNAIAIYNSKVTLKWMEDINLSQKTNFYERNVVGSYRKFNRLTEKGSKQLEYPEDVDF